jgi:DNA-binding transcriptional ArsR family regulator
MTPEQASAAFAALSHPVRLALFRELSARSPYGAPAGELAVAFCVPPSTMTSHLKALQGAQLIKAARRSRYILYSLDTDGAGRLEQFFLLHCLGRNDRVKPDCDCRAD